MASLSLSLSSLSLNAPTGQWVMHCPQRAQSISLKALFSLTPTVVLGPVPCRSHMFRPCIFSHTCMHLIHLTHLEASRISGRLLSQRLFSAVLVTNGFIGSPRSLAIDCNVQFPLLTQLGHSDLWSERISSTFILLIFRSRGLLVMTSSPFLHSVLQAVTNLSIPASSTRQTRQAAISLISLRKHR